MRLALATSGARPSRSRFGESSHGVLPLESKNELNGIYLIRPETTSSEMTGRGWHHGWHRGHAMMAPVMARIIFSLTDADGDGTV